MPAPPTQDSAPHPSAVADTVEFVACKIPLTPLDRLLRGAATREVAGGAIYDALIVACALAAHIDVLLTFNLTFNQRQFERIAAGDIEIAVP